VGTAIEPRKNNLAEAEAVQNVEGNMCGTDRRGADALPRSKTRSRRKGTRRNLGDLRVARNRDAIPGRAGKPDEGDEPVMHGPEKSSARIVPMKPPNKVGRRTGGGGGGGKA
jgi:hypothetical protein